MNPLLLAVAAQSGDFQSYRAHIEAASSALVAGDSRRASEWLAQAPAKHRGWEWDYLNAQTDSSIGSVQTGAPITKLHSTSDGKLVAAAGADGTIRLFDCATLKPVGELKGHKAAVFGLAFSEDGRRLVSTSRDNSIRLWDVTTFTEIGILGEHPTTPYSAAFTPDGKRVVSVGWRMHPERKSPVGLIRVWDVESRKLLHDKDYTTHPISSLDFSPDGARAYIGCWEYQIAVLDMATCSVTAELTPRESSTYKAVDWVEVADDGKSLFAAYKDKTVRKWDLAAGTEGISYVHRGSVASVRQSGNHLVSAGQDGAVRVWNSLTGSETATLYGHGAPITGVAVSTSYTITGDSRGMLRRWDLTNPNLYAPGFTVEGAWSAVYSRNGGEVAVGTSAKRIEIRNAKLEKIREFGEFGSLVVDVAWSPGGDRIAGGSNDGTVRVYVRSGQEIWKFQGKGQMRAVDWSRDGRYIAAGDGATGIGYVFNAENGQVLLEKPMMKGTIAVAFSPDSKRVAFGGGSAVAVMEIATKKVVSETNQLASAAYELAYAPNGQTVAIGEAAGHVQLLRVRDAKVMWTAKTDGAQWGAHFSPDGKRLATFGYDFALHLWEPNSGLEVFALRDLPHEGFDVRFSPEGNRLAFLSGTGLCWTLDRRPFRDRRAR